MICGLNTLCSDFAKLVFRNEFLLTTIIAMLESFDSSVCILAIFGLILFDDIAKFINDNDIDGVLVINATLSARCIKVLRSNRLATNLMVKAASLSTIENIDTSILVR